MPEIEYMTSALAASGGRQAVDPTHPLPVSSTGGYAGLSTGAYGQVTSPGATTTIVTVTPAAGTYEVVVYAVLAGTPGASDIDNVQLMQGASVVSRQLVDAGANLPYASVRYPRLTVNGTTAILLQTIGAGTAGAIYRGQLVLTPVN